MKYLWKIHLVRVKLYHITVLRGLWCSPAGLKVKKSASITVIYPSYNAYESISCPIEIIKSLGLFAAKYSERKYNNRLCSDIDFFTSPLCNLCKLRPCATPSVIEGEDDCAMTLRYARQELLECACAARSVAQFVQDQRLRDDATLLRKKCERTHWMPAPSLRPTHRNKSHWKENKIYIAMAAKTTTSSK